MDHHKTIDLERGTVKLLMRSGFDWTHRYPAIAEAVVALDARRAYPMANRAHAAPTVFTSGGLPGRR